MYIRDPCSCSCSCPLHLCPCSCSCSCRQSHTTSHPIPSHLIPRQGHMEPGSLSSSISMYFTCVFLISCSCCSLYPCSCPCSCSYSCSCSCLPSHPWPRQGHTNPALPVRASVSEDGRLAACGSEDGSVHVWYAGPDSEISWARESGREGEGEGGLLKLFMP